MYSLPQAIDLQQRYYHKGLTIIGIATAFEDYEQNNLDNLNLLIEKNRVIGETLRVLEAKNILNNGLLPYQLSFSIAMDRIIKSESKITDDEIVSFINQQWPAYNQCNSSQQEKIQQRAANYLETRLYTAKTFNLYNLQGTPSHIIVDKKGILRASEFGYFNDLEWFLNTLLEEC